MPIYNGDEAVNLKPQSAATAYRRRDQFSEPKKTPFSQGSIHEIQNQGPNFESVENFDNSQP